VENAVLGFIRLSIRKIEDDAEMKAAFTKLKAEVELALADKNEEMGARLFDLVSYLESRISGESFAAVRKKTAEKNWGMEL
jgi:predicted house-cleaning noncanonical NTP pyrophosphatase (MazG superfamily)